jgi:hypothetical protein
MIIKSHRWELNPRPLGRGTRALTALPSDSALTASRSVAPKGPKACRIGKMNDTYPTLGFAAVRP